MRHSALLIVYRAHIGKCSLQIRKQIFPRTCLSSYTDCIIIPSLGDRIQISHSQTIISHCLSLYHLLEIQNTRENHKCLRSLSHLVLLHMTHSYPHLSRPQAEDASFPYALASALTFVYLYLSSKRTAAMCIRTNWHQATLESD